MSLCIAHLADIHYSKERKDDVFMALRFVNTVAKKNAADLIAVAGDIFDSAVLNTGRAGLADFVSEIKRLGDTAPLAMVHGTPSHDVDQSLEIFKSVNCEYGITILEPGQAYFLHEDGRVIPEESRDAHAGRKHDPESLRLILFGIPEPQRKHLLADNTAGKDESEAAIRDAMRKFCFLLAAKRREYPDIPCVLLYHGDVAGASLQNDQAVERGTGIAITIDDLADIGADYVCLGHIHKPQRVGNLPAYYAGSLIPKNFGETHKAGFNLVTVTKGKAEVNRIDFPHPQNVKIETRYPSEYEIPDGGIEGKRVWLEITCSKEQRALVNPDAELAELRKRGAAEGSRVTVSIMPEETVRAAAITEAATPARKFEVWAENTALEAKESVLKKIASLEVSSGAGRVSGRWELESVRLRGAVGVKKGTGKDEIAVDFARFDSGLIAVTGENGRGKTTLIENCHPYPHLFTRKGKLQDHFCLRNSFREVIYRNAQDGGRVKCLIQIDGANKSGSCKHFIFRNPADGEWEPLPGADGNLKPYEEAVHSLFGPAELYQRTAHIAQKPTKNLPDLSDATAGEKKALFIELAGIGYLQTIAEAANEKAKAEAAKIHDAEIRARLLEEAVSGREAVREELKNAEVSIVEKHGELADVAEAGKAAKAEAGRLREAYDAERERRRKENEARARLNALNEGIRALEAERTRYEEAAKNKAAFEKQTAEYEALKEIISAEEAKNLAVFKENDKARTEFLAAKDGHDKKAGALEAARAGLGKEMTALNNAVAAAQSNIRLYERDAAEIRENCPTCGQKLPPEKIAELENRRRQFAAKIESEKAGIEKYRLELEEAGKKDGALKNEIAGLVFTEPSPPKLTRFDSGKLEEARGKAEAIGIGEARKNLEAARTAAVRIEGVEARIADSKKSLDSAETELSRLAEGSDEFLFEKLERECGEAETRRAELAERYTDCKAGIARLETLIDGLKKRAAETEAREKELRALAAEIAAFKTECSEWELIARGFGRDGVQALELDALAPGISETANRILASAYGDRFSIEIQTVRMGGAGKKVKQIEDFLIYVIDAEDGEPVLLEDKSGGEAVWIKRAIYDAFAVIRKRNTGFAFLTCFQDETDGALDSAAKTAYCRMLEASHVESGMRHSVIITHSSEVKAMIDQKIDMADFAEAVIGTGAASAKDGELWQ
jgi:exonuclease SbcC